MVLHSLVLAWLQGQRCVYASHKKLVALYHTCQNS